MRPAWDSFIKLPFPDMLKGEGEELEAGSSVEFILEFHPGKEKSKAVISQGKRSGPTTLRLWGTEAGGSAASQGDTVARACAALAEDLSSVPSTHMAAHNCF